KLVVWDRDRPAALRRLRQALAAVEVAGVVTNRAFLTEIVAHPAFAAGEVDTGFIERYAADLSPKGEPLSDEALALAAAWTLARRARDAAAAALRSADPWSPWHSVDGWRLNGTEDDLLHFRDGGETVTVRVSYRKGGWRLGLPGGALDLAA